MKLIFSSGPHIGFRYTIEGTITIGRAQEADITIDDQATSLMHCQVAVEHGRASVTDLDSTNGVWVNGKRVSSCALQDGDGIAVGDSFIRVEQTETETSTVADPIDDEDIPALTSVDGHVTYLLKRRLKEGGMGAIYEAEQIGAEGFTKRVAIKTILPSLVERREFVTSFVGEARLVASLVHQNIVQIHHLGRYAQGYYIAMEYIDGINLYQFIRRHEEQKKSIPIDVAGFIVSRVCRGLAYAHTARGADGQPYDLVHRDVSPGNIMISSEGEVKLTDFGVARAAKVMDDEDEWLVGSIEYMSPEQAQCGPVDGRSDIFSLGLVFYELATGTQVFNFSDDDVDAAVQQVSTRTITDPREYCPSLPEAYAAMIMRCLERDPEDRFPSAGRLGDALEQLLYADGYGMTVEKLRDYAAWLGEEASSDTSPPRREPNIHRSQFISREALDDS